MYRYAVSVNASLIRLPEWRKALSESRFHRIELSCGQYLEPQETKELVELVRNADELAGVETASVPLPFCPFEKFPYPVTTTSSKLSDSGRNITFKTPFFGTFTSTVFIPT